MSTPIARTLAAIWLMVVLLCAAQLFSTLSQGRSDSLFDTDMMALLPESERQPWINRATATMAEQFSNDLLLLIGAPKASDAPLRQQTERLAEALRESGQFRAVITAPDALLQQQLIEFYSPYRNQLLTPARRAELTEQSAEQLAEGALRQLYSPVAQPRALPLLDDPFNLLGSWLQGLQPTAGLRTDGWGLVAEDATHRYRVVQLKFIGSPYSPATQQAVLGAIESALRLAELPAMGRDDDAGIAVVRSGLLFHAAAGAEQARGEISTIGLGSLCGIVLLLGWFFRRIRPLLLPVLSIGVGLLFALTLTLWLFGRVHVITLAFGASLVGVSIDYALHFLCCQRREGANTLRHVLPGITLGLLTSVLAYSAQAATPFPGLRQMATFSALGLVGAWVTVLCWFPLLNHNANVSEPSSALWRALQRLATLRPLLLGLGVAVVLVSLYGWSQLQFVDRLQDLQTSPQALMDDEATVQRLSQRGGASRFLLIEAADGEALLQREEQLRKTLDQLVAEQQLASYQALSQWVPSQARQRRDAALVESRLKEEGAQQQLLSRLGVAEGRQTVTDFQTGLDLARWQRSAVAKLLPSLLIADEDEGRVVSVISLGAAEGGAYQRLERLAEQTRGVSFVDRVDDISKLLARYRTTLMIWITAAIGLIVMLLSYRYGRYGWRVLAVPLTATLLTFGLLAALGTTLSLFHLLAALLVLGIGLDMGIFLRESDHQSHAWEAVTLSAATSLLAFGLLAFSLTPVLHQFGIVVLTGILLTWLLSLLLAAERIQQPMSLFDRAVQRK